MKAALQNATSLYRAFEPLLSKTDREIWALFSEDFLADVREAMTQGPWGGGWDNVAWVGPWDFDPTTVECPVLLWYGDEDRMAAPFHAKWFETNLQAARLTMFKGEGHLLPFTHLEQMLTQLLAG